MKTSSFIVVVGSSLGPLLSHPEHDVKLLEPNNKGKRVVFITLDIIILVGLVVVAYLNYLSLKRIDELDEVIGQMLYDLGKKGVLDVDINEEGDE